GPPPCILEMVGIGGSPREKVPFSSGCIRLPKPSGSRPHQETAVRRPNWMLIVGAAATYSVQAAAVGTHEPDAEWCVAEPIIRLAGDRNPRPCGIPCESVWIGIVTKGHGLP